ncbi:MAG: NAD(P)-dependent oxidoreductase [Rubrivivax sp.]|nr:NAD(P)-dependent oxidoreductase [Rubrivivax sp.]
MSERGEPNGRKDPVGPGGPVGPVGLVGLGLVGTALAARLAQAGFAVLGFDRRDEACAAFARSGLRGAGVATTPAEIGQRCERVVLAVFDTAGVLEVVEGPRGLLSAPDAATRLIVDCSTGEPDALRALAARLAARGVDFLEAPLSGSSRQIAAGTATLLLGGAAHVAAAPANAALLDALSPRRIHAGGAGMGACAKLATNLVLGLNRAVLAEGFVFAEQLGIAPSTFLELVLATPARSEAALAKGGQMVRGDFGAPQSRIRQHLKDVELMLDSANAAGQRLPLSQAHASLLRAAVAAGDGELDNAAVIRQLRRERSPG